MIVCKNGFPNTRTGGLEVDNEGCRLSDSETKPVNQEETGVLVVFDPPFADIPSVIVTLVVIGEYSRKHIPRCIVESITTKQTRVKCGIVSNSGKDTMYSAIPFNIAAFGTLGG